MQLYDPQQHRGHAALYGRDPGVDCHAYAALTLGLWLRTKRWLHMHGADPGRQLAYPLSQGWTWRLRPGCINSTAQGAGPGAVSGSDRVGTSIAFLRYRRWEVSYTAGQLRQLREKEHRG